MGYLFPDFFALEIAVDINWSAKKDAIITLATVIGNFENSRWHLKAYAAIVSNDHIRPILGLITMPIVINVEPLFLIRS